MKFQEKRKEMQECVAPNCFGLQCCNPIVNGHRFHCVQHHTKALKLYEEYKKICIIADTFDIKKYKLQPTLHEQLKYLQRCYYMTTRAYEGRQKHRNYAFIPKYYDHGHNIQFHKLMRKIDKCEKYLEQIYQEIKEINKEEDKDQVIQFLPNEEPDNKRKDDDITTKKEQYELIQKIHHQVQNFKLQRKVEEIEIQRLLNQYVSANISLLEDKKKLVQHMESQLQIFIKDASDIELFFVLHTIIKLKNWKFFNCEETDDFFDCKLQHPPKKFTTIIKYIYATFDDFQLHDLILLTEMYQKKIQDVIGNWKKSTDQKLYVGLIINENDDSIYLTNTTPDFWIFKSNMVLSKYQMKRNPIIDIMQLKNMHGKIKIKNFPLKLVNDLLEICAKTNPEDQE